jgi:hypothetical protein
MGPRGHFDVGKSSYPIRIAFTFYKKNKPILSGTYWYIHSLGSINKPLSNRIKAENNHVNRKQNK